MPKYLNKIVNLLVALTMFFQSTLVFAEGSFFEVKEPARAAEYIYRSAPRESLIGVQLMGAVKHPGMYYIPSNTDILKLITLAGGVEDGNLSEIVVRKTDSNNSGVYELDMNKFMKSAPNTKPFQLAQDDFIYVPRKEPWISNDVSRTITIVSLITSIILTGVLIERNSSR